MFTRDEERRGPTVRTSATSFLVWPQPVAWRGHMSTATLDYALLRDGGGVLIRPYMPADRTAVAALFAGLSPESRLLRFHSAGAALDERTLDLVTTGHVLVAALEGQIVALASYVQLRDPQR